VGGKMRRVAVSGSRTTSAISMVYISGAGRGEEFVEYSLGGGLLLKGDGRRTSYSKKVEEFLGSGHGRNICGWAGKSHLIEGRRTAAIEKIEGFCRKPKARLVTFRMGVVKRKTCSGSPCLGEGKEKWRHTCCAATKRHMDGFSQSTVPLEMSKQLPLIT